MIYLNALRGVSARVLTTKTGAWIADVDIDLEAVPVVPSGRAVLTIGLSALSGTIDDRASGRFGTKARVRVVGGGGGWDSPVQANHLHNDAGVLSTAAYAAMGAMVGETVVELGAPRVFGVDHVTTGGPASQVFAGADWWVDALGITYVGPRPPLPAPPTIDILSWDAKAKVAEVASDVLLVPGMVLTDPVLFGVATIDDVEQTFGEDGARAFAWCSTPSIGETVDPLASPPAAAGAKLVQALGALARQSAGVSKLKRYPYRVIAQGPDGRLNLQSTSRGLVGGECPPFLRLIDVWGGLPGLSVKIPPLSIVLVSFIDHGDPLKQQPVVVAFDPDSPPAIEVKVDGVRLVLGTLGLSPVAKAPGILSALTAIEAAFTAIGAYATAVAAGPIAPLTAPAAAALVPALAAALAAITTASALIPSPKAFTD